MVELVNLPLNFLSQPISRVLNPTKGFGTKFENVMFAGKAQNTKQRTKTTSTHTHTSIYCI